MLTRFVGRAACCPPQVVGHVVRQHPWWTLLPPILTFVVLVALGVMGALIGAQNEVDNRRDTAVAVAIDTGASFKLTVEKVRGVGACTASEACVARHALA
jgi:hypothetical protein